MRITWLVECWDKVILTPMSCNEIESFDELRRDSELLHPLGLPTSIRRGWIYNSGVM